MNSYTNEHLCPGCDRWHVPGKCSEGTPAPTMTVCPRCDAEGRGNGLLVRGYNTDTGRSYYACADDRCRWGQTLAKKPVKTPRRRKKARTRR